MDQIQLTAERRAIIGKKVKQLRREGKVPAIIYGTEIDPIPIQVDGFELSTVLRRAGANRLITVNVKGDSHPHLTLTRDVQRDVITRNLLHVDFQEVVLTQKITSEVPIIIEGTPGVVRAGEAIINQMLDAIEIEALPTDLIPSITIDISNLEEVDEAVYVRDLDLPDRVTVLTKVDEIIVRLSAPQLEREEIEKAIPEEAVEVGAVAKEEGPAAEE
jgi:large subunit ribosomal protein L25